MTSQKLELRNHERSGASGKVKVDWRDAEGRSFGGVGTVLDSSPTGIRVLLERSIPAGTDVRVESRDLHILGIAIAKNCRPKGLKYEVGLQLRPR
jgi:hypothetical protein